MCIRPIHVQCNSCSATAAISSATATVTATAAATITTTTTTNSFKVHTETQRNKFPCDMSPYFPLPPFFSFLKIKIKIEARV